MEISWKPSTNYTLKFSIVQTRPSSNFGNILGGGGGG